MDSPWRRWLPVQTEMAPSRLFLAALFGLVSVGLAAWVGHHTLGPAAPFLVASMGAAAVLLFVVPGSPMSTPWALVGGHLVSVTLGITFYRFLQDPVLAAPLAVGGAIAAMYWLRCLHPPGGAAALLSVVGGEPVHQLGYGFLLTPVGLNVAVMLALLLVYRRYIAGHHGNDREDIQPGRLHDGKGPLPFDERDLSQALTDMGSFVDVTHEDLKEIYLRALALAHARRAGGRTCGEAARPAVAVEFADDLERAWRLLNRHELDAVPIVDRKGHFLGLLTRHAFLEAAERWGDGDIARGCHLLCTREGRLESEKPEAAGQLITRNVPTAHENDPLPPWIETLYREGLPLLPVTDDRDRLIGIILPRRHGKD